MRASNGTHLALVYAPPTCVFSAPLMPLFSDSPPPRDLPDARQWEVLVWTDAVHEHNESCVLSFWRLSFGPDYERDEVFAKLDAFYSQTRITAHIAYETLGDFDLLLRLWIPRSYLPEEIEARLAKLLRENSLWNINYIACHTQAHWAQPHDDVSRDEDDGDLPVAGLTTRSPIVVSDALITQINAFNDAQVRGNPVSRPLGSQKLIDEDKVLIPIPLRTKGVRFYITFGSPQRPLTPNARADLLAQIKAKCRAIRRRWATAHPRSADDDPDKKGPQISIYSGGGGTMNEFFIMARAPHGDFHEFVHTLVHGLRETSLGSVYQMRPQAYVIADRMFSELTEHLLSVESADFSEQMLYVNESETLEFKATFGVNLRRYRADGTLKRDDVIIDQVVKTVCGLLNSPDGGSLIIGVLEVHREVTKLGVHADDYLAWLKHTFNYVPRYIETDGLNRTLANAVIGVGLEYSGEGPYRDADTYQGAIHDVLKDHIVPDPWPWLRMAIRRVAGVEVAVISVRPADTWCYARLSSAGDLQFFVREAASTRAYSGHEADLYKQANPR